MFNIFKLKQSKKKKQSVQIISKKKLISQDGREIYITTCTSSKPIPPAK